MIASIHSCNVGVWILIVGLLSSSPIWPCDARDYVKSNNCFASTEKVFCCKPKSADSKLFEASAADMVGCINETEVDSLCLGWPVDRSSSSAGGESGECTCGPVNPTLAGIPSGREYDWKRCRFDEYAECGWNDVGGSATTSTSDTANICLEDRLWWPWTWTLGTALGSTFCCCLCAAAFMFLVCSAFSGGGNKNTQQQTQRQTGTGNVDQFIPTQQQQQHVRYAHQQASGEGEDEQLPYAQDVTSQQVPLGMDRSGMYVAEHSQPYQQPLPTYAQLPGSQTSTIPAYTEHQQQHVKTVQV